MARRTRSRDGPVEDSDDAPDEASDEDLVFVGPDTEPLPVWADDRPNAPDPSRRRKEEQSADV